MSGPRDKKERQDKIQIIGEHVMSSNKEIVIESYRDAGEEGRATASRASSLEFYYTKKHISDYIKPTSSVIELGCGTGYYAMCFSGQCKEYVLSLIHI